MFVCLFVTEWFPELCDSWLTEETRDGRGSVWSTRTTGRERVGSHTHSHTLTHSLTHTHILHRYIEEEEDDDDDDLVGGLPPPRLFCDICDEFDKHDTDDCPLQAGSDSPPPSMHHGTRAPGGSDRPYCTNCESKFSIPCHFSSKFDILTTNFKSL